MSLNIESQVRTMKYIYIYIYSVSIEKKSSKLIDKTLPGEKTTYQGSSAVTSRWLNIFPALNLLLVGIGSPAGVCASHAT